MPELAIQKILRHGGLEALAPWRLRINCDNDGLYQFHYHQVDTPKDEVGNSARGIILDSKNNWSIVARPFDRFFNIEDSLADSIDWRTAVATEKLDGSLIIMYYHAGMWRFSTKGSITAGGSLPGSPDMTYAEEVSRLVWMPPPDYQRYTFLFEYIGPNNRVVVYYARPQVALLAMRDTQSGEYAPESVRRYMAWRGTGRLPYCKKAGTREALMAEVKSPEFRGEGYVVTDAYGGRLKIKSPWYVAAHKTRTHFSRAVALEAIQRNTADSLLEAVPDRAPEILRLNARYRELAEHLEGLTRKLKAATVDRKSFAGVLPGVVHPILQPAMFQLYSGKAATGVEALAVLKTKALASLLGEGPGEEAGE